MNWQHWTHAATVHKRGVGGGGWVRRKMAVAAVADTQTFEDPSGMRQEELRRRIANVEAERRELMVQIAAAPPVWLFKPKDNAKAALTDVARRDDVSEGLFMVTGPHIKDGEDPGVVHDINAPTGAWWYKLYSWQFRLTVHPSYEPDSSALPPSDYPEYFVDERTIEWQNETSPEPHQLGLDRGSWHGLEYNLTVYATIEDLIAGNGDLFSTPLVEDRPEQRAIEQRVAVLAERKTQLDIALEQMLAVISVVVSTCGCENYVDSMRIPPHLMATRDVAPFREFMEAMGIYGAAVFYGQMIRLGEDTTIATALWLFEQQGRSPSKVLAVVHGPRALARAKARAAAAASAKEDHGAKRTRLQSRIGLVQPQSRDPPFTIEHAARAAHELCVDTSVVSEARLLVGMNVEWEHGSKYGASELNLTADSVVMTAKIALAHFFENPGLPGKIQDYYEYLARNQTGAEREWARVGEENKPLIFADCMVRS